LLAETVGIGAALVAATAALTAAGAPAWTRVPTAVATGFWMQRLYVVGHEASHGKLVPDHRRLNDAVGQLFLLPILVPLPVFRKIHRFHHGYNRRDPHTSALDVHVVPVGAGPLRRGWGAALWYLSAFAGGWFVHSLVSILLFLLLPTRLAERVSPAFAGWSVGDRARSIGAFLAAGGLWWAFVAAFGVETLVWCALVPLAAFAWVYSAQLYIYHYRTTIGPDVRFHARCVRGRLLSWWLCNLNWHATHHARPSLVWYALPGAAEPPKYVENADSEGFWRAVAAQLAGPTWVEDRPRGGAP
jgi:fatty acid desaturase